MILMHISNRHLELAEGRRGGRRGRRAVASCKTDDKANNFIADFRANAEVAVLARNEADLGAAAARDGWEKAEAATRRGLDRRLFRHHRRDAAQEVSER